MAIEIHKVSTEDGNSHHTARDQPTVPRFLTDSGLGLSLQLGFQPQFPCLGPWCFVRTLHQESQPGIKTARRNINNLRYADDTTLMGETEEELNSLLRRLKEESEKTGLKLNIQKAKIMDTCPIPSWQIDGEKVETVTDFYFLRLQNHCEW